MFGVTPVALRHEKNKEAPLCALRILCENTFLTLVANYLGYSVGKQLLRRNCPPII